MILLESIFRLEGVECLSLGTEMPIVEIPFALKAFNPDQLILTFNNPKISQKLKLAYDEIKPFLVPFKTELLVFLDRSKKEKNLSLDTPVFHDFESIKEYVLSWKDKYYKIT